MILEAIGTTLLAGIIYISIDYLMHLWKIKDYPPGPIPLPLIGNLHLLGKQPHVKLAEIAKKYGDVFSISFGMNRIVIVNACQPAREALITKGDKFAGRPSNMYTASLVSRGHQNIVFDDYGPRWKLTRKFAHSAMKLYGDGLGKAEKLMIQESQAIHERLRELNGKPVDIHDEIGLGVLNIISSMLFGSRYERDDPEFLEVLSYTTLILQGLGSSEPVAVLPWLRFFPLEGLKKLRKGIEIRDPLMHKKLMEHVATFDGKNVRDVTDALLKVTKEEEFVSKLDSKPLTDEQMELILNDIFIGGTETTVSTARWFIVYMLYWPQYQNMLFEEMTNVTSCRYPSYKDKSSMPLWQAMFHETLRLSSLAPLGIPHKAMEKSELGGQSIPKNTTIMINHWQIHHDENFWKNPHEFCPERWLDKNNEFTPGNRISYLAFSAGRRGCLGEVMAKVELFHLLTRMVRDFKIEKVENESLPSLQGVPGITLAPESFKCIFTPRAESKHNIT